MNKLKSNDFKSLRENGKTFKTRNFLFVYKISKEAEAEKVLNFGFTITKKVGKAVLRNRLRRLLREAVRLCALEDSKETAQKDTKFKLSLNIVVLQKNPENLVYSEVHEQIQYFLNTRVYS
ncbi:MAG: ribonuclease P protein component [Bdellovibrionales bacterium]